MESNREGERVWVFGERCVMVADSCSGGYLDELMHAGFVLTLSLFFLPAPNIPM